MTMYGRSRNNPVKELQKRPYIESCMERRNECFLSMLSHNHLIVKHALLAHGFHLRIQLVHGDYVTYRIFSPEPSPGSHICHFC